MRKGKKKFWRGFEWTRQWKRLPRRLRYVSYFNHARIGIHWHVRKATKFARPCLSNTSVVCVHARVCSYLICRCERLYMKTKTSRAWGHDNPGLNTSPSYLLLWEWLLALVISHNRNSAPYQVHGELHPNQWKASVSQPDSMKTTMKRRHKEPC